MNTALGYVVVEACEAYEQILGLDIRPEYPHGGILSWVRTGDAKAPTLFATRAEAKAAIERTEHMRLAFGWRTPPEKRFCRIVSIYEASEQPATR
jgi:hypothetical protein